MWVDGGGRGRIEFISLIMQPLHFVKHDGLLPALIFKKQTLVKRTLSKTFQHLSENKEIQQTSTFLENEQTIICRSKVKNFKTHRL